MTPQLFIQLWQGKDITERQGAQQHFNDLCDVLGVDKPRDPENYCFERGAKIQSGQGWADVWKRGHFAWEYKGPGQDLKAALKQLMNYALALDNPPLLVVSDLLTIEIHTHFTGHPSEIHRFAITDLTQPEVLQKLRWLFTEPERFKPARTTFAVTEQAATRMGDIAKRLTERGDDPHTVAHFLIQCVFCMFAEDAKLLPEKLFETVLDRSNPDGSKAKKRLADLFTAMQGGGDFAMNDIPWFNGGLFKHINIPELNTADVVELLEAARMNWSDIEPAILGTLFERGLNPDMRSQLGAHYTDPTTIMKLITPVVEQPLRAEWELVKAKIAKLSPHMKLVGSAKSNRPNKEMAEGYQLFRDFLTRLRGFKVLDPACGSGNFLYLALKTLKDLEHRVNIEVETLGLHRELTIETSPANVLGIELNPYAAELARVTVWIGEIQWMLSHGYQYRKDPILAPLDHIECRDAILNFPPSPSIPLPAGEGNSSASPSGRGVGVRDAVRAKGEPTFHAIPFQLLEYARELRKSQTDAENLIWGLLRNRRLADAKFRRQHPVGRYILDFYCDHAKLAVELDGGQHGEQQAYDAERDAWLQSQGITVLRFWNNDVLASTESVLETIHSALTKSPSPPAPIPSPQALSQRERELKAGEGGEAEWPTVNAIVGNPPFLGGSKKRRELGDDYFNALSAVYKTRVPDGADLVCYWFEKARAHIEQAKTKAAGLVTTQAIRAGSNRKVLERILESQNIYEAWSDEPWVNNGAAVRVSLVCFAPPSPASGRGAGGEGTMLDGQPVTTIHADLTACGGLDLTQAQALKENAGVSFEGTKKYGDFDIPGEQARQWLKLPNPNGRPNSDVVKPWANGKDITARPTDTWIVDFGTHLPEYDAALYETPFAHVLQHVKNQRQDAKWWLHERPRPELRKALTGLPRYIATPRVAKHRFFVWLPAALLPDTRLNVIARNDDTTFGILSSRLHEVWSLANASVHGDGSDGGRPTYNAKSCFETFPFPAGLTPQDTLTRPDGRPLPRAGEGSSSPSPSGRGVGVREVSAEKENIAQAAQHLDQLRNTWLNPTEWVDWVRTPEEEKAGYPARPVAKPGFEAELKKRTLTNLYNARPAWLDNAHKALDAAVAAAYGWTDYTAEMPDEEILRRLLKLNLERSS